MFGGFGVGVDLFVPTLSFNKKEIASRFLLTI